MIVNTNVKYNSQILKKDINLVLVHYPFVKLLTIVYSVLEKPIYCLKIGTGPRQVFYSGAIHANEWICSNMLMKFVEELCIANNKNSSLFGYNIRNLLHKTSIYICPMVNPDGVDLLNGEFNLNSNEYRYARYIANKYPNVPFPNGWKANINGVDLNLQFPAGWENAKKIKFSQGITSPAPRDFVGNKPLAEPEALALYNFTLTNKFELILAYHTQGKEIYWQYQNYAPKISYEIGRKFANASGYLLTDVPYESSFAGYKDWFLQNYSKPAFTIEAGIGENPLPLSQFNNIYRDNIGIMVFGAVLQLEYNMS